MIERNVFHFHFLKKIIYSLNNLNFSLKYLSNVLDTQIKIHAWKIIMSTYLEISKILCRNRPSCKIAVTNPIRKKHHSSYYRFFIESLEKHALILFTTCADTNKE